MILSSIACPRRRDEYLRDWPHDVSDFTSGHLEKEERGEKGDNRDREGTVVDGGGVRWSSVDFITLFC